MRLKKQTVIVEDIAKAVPFEYCVYKTVTRSVHNVEIDEDEADDNQYTTVSGTVKVDGRKVDVFAEIEEGIELADLPSEIIVWQE